MNDPGEPQANANEPISEPNKKEAGMLRNVGNAEAGWRVLAQRIQHETNPDQLSVLVQQLIAEFDREKLRKNLSQPT